MKIATYKLTLMFVLSIVYSTLANAQEIGQPYKVSGALQGFGDVSSYKLSDNNQWVVFMADAIQDDKVELFSVPITGGPRVTLNAAMTTNRDVFNFWISPDSAHVVFTADSLTDEKRELFIVPIAGGSVIRLNAANMPAEADIFGADFAYNAQSKKIVFTDSERISSSPTIQNINLSSVNSDGTNLTQLNFPTTDSTRARVRNYAVSPDAQTVAFAAGSNDTFSDTEVFTVNIDGASSPVTLSTNFVQSFLLEYSRSGGHLLFDQIFNGQRQLFSVPALGGTPVRLQNVDENVRTRSIRVTSDSQRVVYAVGGAFDSEIYSVPIAGGVPTFLDTTNDSDGIALVANNTTALYAVDTALQNISALRRIPINGGTPLTIDEPSGSFRPSGALSPDGQTVVSMGRVNINGNNFNARFEVRSVPFAGGSATILTEYGASPAITSDSEQVIYLRRTRNVNNDLINELYIQPINGGAEISLSGTMAFMGSIDNYVLTSDSQYAVFRGDKDAFEQDELFVVKAFEPVVDEELCLPIKTGNGKFVVICL